MSKIIGVIGLVVLLFSTFGVGIYTFFNNDENNNNTAMSEQIDGLKIEDTKLGEGDAVKQGDTIKIHYNGTLEDGTKFDSSYDRGQPFETQIGVGMLIQGWDLGIPGMKVGGKRKLTISPDLGYGANGVPGAIPGNATLIFEVELIEIL